MRWFSPSADMMINVGIMQLNLLVLLWGCLGRVFWWNFEGIYEYFGLGAYLSMQGDFNPCISTVSLKNDYLKPTKTFLSLKIHPLMINISIKSIQKKSDKTQPQETILSDTLKSRLFVYFSNFQFKNFPLFLIFCYCKRKFDICIKSEKAINMKKMKMVKIKEEKYDENSIFFVCLNYSLNLFTFQSS